MSLQPLRRLRVIFPLLGKPPIASPFPTIVFWTSKMSGACCRGSFQRIADSSVSSRRKLHRAQPLVQQLVFFEKREREKIIFLSSYIIFYLLNHDQPCC